MESSELRSGKMGKVSRETTEKRQQSVWEQYVRGIPQYVIAQALGIHKNTVWRDIEELKEKNKVNIQDMDPQMAIGDIAAKYDEIFKYAIDEYSTAGKGAQKAQYLEKALLALGKKTQLLTDTGVLPKAATEINSKVVVEGVDINRASLQELRALRDKLHTKTGLRPAVAAALDGEDESQN